jgi:roadblock/LC7 domain-containing protein
LQGDRKPFPFLQTRFNESAAQFSPDGRWVAYTSNESGRSEVYVREFTPSANSAEAGGKWIVSTDGGYLPGWRADGKEIYYSAGNGQNIMMSLSVDTSHSFHAGIPRQLFQLPGGTVGGSPTPDLKRWLSATPVEERTPQSFTVVLNWTAGLKK